MNRKALRQIISEVETEPPSFDMGKWFGRSRETMCGSVGCIAGKAVINDRLQKTGKPLKTVLASIARDNANGFDFHTNGREALGLSSSQAWRLFYVSYWPARFADAYYYDAKTAEDKAKVFVKRARYFIRTNGTDGDEAAFKGQ
jgi:hypothetical protein